MNFSPALFFPFCISLSSCGIVLFRKIFRTIFKIHDHVTIKALLIHIWGINILNYFKNLLSLAWFHTDGALWVTWDIRQALAQNCIHSSFLLQWGCVSFLSQGSCGKVTAVFGELTFLGCAYSTCVWIMLRMFRDFLLAFISCLFSLSL